MMSATSGAITVLDTLIQRLSAAAEYNENQFVPPLAVFWTDSKEEWGEVAPKVREQMPRFWTLGPYDPAEFTGPAIWLRTRLTEQTQAEGSPATPVIYLPGVSRHDLRAVEDCPQDLKPLAAVQYQGVLWTQASGRDWTLNAYLQSNRGGLGLDVAGDDATQEAIRRSAAALVETPVDHLRGHRLEADDFDALLADDIVRDLLEWMNAPKLMQEEWPEQLWEAFRSRARNDYDFDPVDDGELTAAEKLVTGEPPWDSVWRRFTEAPESYPNLRSLLSRVAPPDLFLNGRYFPQENERLEESLRAGLEKLSDLTHPDACSRIDELERVHGERRTWVWASLGQAPLARALAHLDTIATLSPAAPAFGSPEAAADYYCKSGWRIDAACLAALQAVKEKKKDQSAVFTALRSLALPWLKDTAKRLQDCVLEEGYPESAEVEAEDGTCLLFADGLRFDLAQQLSRHLTEAGREVEISSRWAALPTVTSTCKYTASPIADQVAGTMKNVDFCPEVAESGKRMDIKELRKLLDSSGYQVLFDADTGDPNSRAWTEAAQIDPRGHSEGWKLAWRVEEELRELQERIQDLLDAGWREVRVVTDHGWLLMPDGLPQLKLAPYLAKTKWSRCATLKEEAKYDGPIVPWHWCPDVAIALAPSASVFFKGEYAHGGISLQECVTPVLSVTGGDQAPSATLEEPIWRGLRCRISVLGAVLGMAVDLRTKPADADSSLAHDEQAAPIDSDGSASILVSNDDLLGTAAHLVLLDRDGRVVAKRLTTVGGE